MAAGQSRTPDAEAVGKSLKRAKIRWPSEWKARLCWILSVNVMLKLGQTKMWSPSTPAVSRIAAEAARCQDSRQCLCALFPPSPPC
jgi:hypothetical protein